SAQNMPLEELGGSLAVGILISAILTVLIGITGLGPKIATLFNPAVMGVFMFLFGVQLVGIFLKGMLGIPFGNDATSGSIDLSVSLLSIVIAIIVIIISVIAPPTIRRYGLLIGIIIGWPLYTFIFGVDASVGEAKPFHFELFPFGAPAWNTGIIITVILTGLLNTANTFGSLKGTDGMYKSDTTNKQYRNSFMIGGVIFFMMGVIPQIGTFFSLLPLSIGSAVLFVSYLQLLNSSWNFFKQVTFNTINVYRSAIPLFVGIIIMTMPANYFETLPEIIRPLISNGLLVGITLALLLENLISWERIGVSSTEKEEAK